MQEHGWLTRPTCTVSWAIYCSSVYIFISSNIYPQSLVYIHSLQPILIFSGIHIHSLWFMFIVFTEALSSSPKCSLQSCHPLNFPFISLPLFRGNITIWKITVFSFFSSVCRGPSWSVFYCLYSLCDPLEKVAQFWMGPETGVICFTREGIY